MGLEIELLKSRQTSQGAGRATTSFCAEAQIKGLAMLHAPRPISFFGRWSRGYGAP